MARSKKNEVANIAPTVNDNNNVDNPTATETTETTASELPTVDVHNEATSLVVSKAITPEIKANWLARSTPTKFDFKEMTLGDIDKGCNAIARSGANQKKLAHELLVGVLVHYAKCGDYTKLPQVIEVTRVSMGASVANAMKAYVMEMSTLIFRGGKWLKAENTKPMFAGQGGGNMKDGEYDFAKMLEYTSPKGIAIATKATDSNGEEVNKPLTFFEIGKADELPAPVDFLQRLASLVNAAHKLNTERKAGIDHNGKKVKIEHKHIDDDMVHALDDFAKGHGLAPAADTGKWGIAVTK
jgi:hypothetical protein